MKDKSGNIYIQTAHSRVTLVRNRPSQDKDWTGNDTLRIQALQASGKLHMGAEIPIEDLPDFLKGIGELLISSAQASPAAVK